MLHVFSTLALRLPTVKRGWHSRGERPAVEMTERQDSAPMDAMPAAPVADGEDGAPRVTAVLRCCLAALRQLLHAKRLEADHLDNGRQAEGDGGEVKPHGEPL